VQTGQQPNISIQHLLTLQDVIFAHIHELFYEVGKVQNKYPNDLTNDLVAV